MVSELVKKRIDKASHDPEILSRGVVDVMRIYSLPFASAKKAINKARKRHAKNGTLVEAQREAYRKRQAASHLKALHTAAGYDGLLNELATTPNMSRTGRRFGITRERVRQFRKALFGYVELTGKSLKTVLDEVTMVATEDE